MQCKFVLNPHWQVNVVLNLVLYLIMWSCRFDHVPGKISTSSKSTSALAITCKLLLFFLPGMETFHPWISLDKPVDLCYSQPPTKSKQSLFPRKQTFRMELCGFTFIRGKAGFTTALRLCCLPSLITFDPYKHTDNNFLKPISFPKS